MDRAVSEIVEWLDDGTEFPYPASEAVDTLEAIVGFHASHARNAAWTEFPAVGCRPCARSPLWVMMQERFPSL